MKTSTTNLLLLSIILVLLGISVVTASAAVHLYKKINVLALSPLALDTGKNTEKTNRKRIGGLIIIGDSRAKQWEFNESFNALQITNLGVNGHTSRQTLLRNKLILPNYKPKSIIIQVGINDLKTIPLLPTKTRSIIDNCKENISNLVSAAKSTSADKIILTSIFPTGNIPFYRKPFWSKSIDKAIIEINNHLESLAVDGVEYLDVNPILSNKKNITKTTYQRDFLHLNKNGYNEINHILLPMLLNNN